MESSDLRTSAHLAARILATAALLILPDLAFFGPGAVAGYGWSSIIAIVSVAVLSSLMRSRNAKVALLVAVSVGQIVWIGSWRIFGAPLRPDQFMLFFSEINDTASGALAETRILAPILGVLLATTAALITIHIRATGPFFRHAGLLLCLVLAVLAGRWTAGKAAIAKFPGEDSASAIGTAHAAIASLRYALLPARPPPGTKLNEEKFSITPVGEEPVTIAVIMGESINPARLSLFGAANDTTPNLKLWRETPPFGLTMLPRIGFAGGVATLASVPTFIRTAFVPIRAESRGLNLFEMARKADFKAWFLSAQHLHFLASGGGAPGAVRIEGSNTNAELFARVADDYLVDFVKDVPGSAAPHQFIFLHQRTNHANYVENCAHVTPSIFTIPVDTSSELDMRRGRYDNGLRCWDRSVVGLVTALMEGGRKGAVHIFLTADHNELMGEEGLVGHTHPNLRTAAVPMILLTNRPQSDVAKAFAAMRPASTYNLTRVVLAGMGVALAPPEEAHDTFYFNKTLPYGMSGYLEARQIDAWTFKYRVFARSGTLEKEGVAEFPEFGRMEAVAAPAKQAAR